MAYFTYECVIHGKFRVSSEKREKVHKCPFCSEPCRAIIKVGGVSVNEILDNGAMSRKVERLHNIEEITAEIDRLDTERVVKIADDET
jgi:hypothetical protein